MYMIVILRHNDDNYCENQLLWYIVVDAPFVMIYYTVFYELIVHIVTILCIKPGHTVLASHQHQKLVGSINYFEWLFINYQDEAIHHTQIYRWVYNSYTRVVEMSHFV